MCFQKGGIDHGPLEVVRLARQFRATAVKRAMSPTEIAVVDCLVRLFPVGGIASQPPIPANKIMPDPISRAFAQVMMSIRFLASQAACY